MAKRRGFTLVEMMVASTVAMVGIVAAAAVFTSQGAFQRKTERQMSVLFSANAALTSLTRDAENAGYHWPVPAAAVIAGDNLEEGSRLPNGSGLEDDAQVVLTDEAQAQEGLLPQSDALDVWMGRERVGTVATDPVAASGTTSGKTLLLTGHYPLWVQAKGDPAADSEAPSSDPAQLPLLLFVNPANLRHHCLGQVTLSGFLDPQAEVVVEPRAVGSLEPLSSFPSFTVGASTLPCPSAQMKVYALGQRKRYLSLQTVSAGASKPDRGLYVQTANKQGVLGAPRLLAAGVNDLQVAYWADNSVENGARPLAQWPGCASASLCRMLSSSSSDDRLSEALPHWSRLKGLDIQLETEGTDPQKRAAEPSAFVKSIASHRPPSSHQTTVLNATVHLNNFSWIEP